MATLDQLHAAMIAAERAEESARHAYNLAELAGDSRTALESLNAASIALDAAEAAYDGAASEASITFEGDPALLVQIDRAHLSALVRFQYGNDGWRATPFQTADMPPEDQEAAALISDWLDHG
jgi:hypothetical protein